MATLFTLTEAQRLLPRVADSLAEAIAAKARYETHHAELRGVSQKVALSGGAMVDRDRFIHIRSQREAAAIALKERLDNIQDFGCVVKDLDTGLIDFATLYRGEEVCLCWKLGESSIQFWHGVDEGFAGRKPIDEEFRQHHSTGRIT